jgi:Ca2+-transporting ATPase
LDFGELIRQSAIRSATQSNLNGQRWSRTDTQSTMSWLRSARARSGLSQAESQQRLERYGRNELAAESPIPKWRKFLSQFTAVLVILLMIAGAVSAGLWLYERGSMLPYETIAIFAIVLLNALTGYVQQARAEKALAALRQTSAPHANVIRDSARRNIPATELVPGDVIMLADGDTIPADARLIQSTALQTMEAALTGESLPLSKDIVAIREEAEPGDQNNMAFSGTIATYGHGLAVVTATGMQTQMGRIAGMLKQAPDEPTPLQKELSLAGDSPASASMWPLGCGMRPRHGRWRSLVLCCRRDFPAPSAT